MANLVISGDTSGAVTLAAPAVAGTTTLTLPTASGTVITTASTTGVNASAISTGTIAGARLPAGSVLQVVSSTPTTLICNSSTFIDIISQSITPTSATSKILVTASCYIGINGNTDRQVGNTQLLRGASVIWGPVNGPTQGIDDPSGYHFFTSSGTFVYLDSPATTSSTTYTIQGNEDSDQWSNYRSVALILMEIAA